MTRSVVPLAALAVALVATPAHSEPKAQDAAPHASQAAAPAPVLSKADRTFLEDAARGGLLEVELGRIAAQRSASPDVKAFGQQMVDDHTKVDTRLAQIAGPKGVTLPTELDKGQQATVQRLSKLQGAQFDRAYVTDMVRDHTKDVAEFDRETKLASDTDVKSFAVEMLPTLESHLGHAKQLEEKLEAERRKH